MSAWRIWKLCKWSIARLAVGGMHASEGPGVKLSDTSIDYCDREKQVEKEFGLAAESDADSARVAKRFEMAVKLDIEQPELDEFVREEIVRPANLDPVYFAQEIPREIWSDFE